MKNTSQDSTSLIPGQNIGYYAGPHQVNTEEIKKEQGRKELQTQTMLLLWRPNELGKKTIIMSFFKCFIMYKKNIKIYIQE